MNAAECLLSAGADAAVALECGDRRVTYAELRAAVPRAGARGARSDCSAVRASSSLRLTATTG